MLALLVLAVIGGIAYGLVSGDVPPFGASGRTSPGRPGGSVAPVSARSVGTALAPASVAAFGPDGTADGDNPQLASHAIDGNPATPWTTNWYAMPRFANVQGGTGLLMDMGHPVTITGAEVTLGSVPGADFQLRAGNMPSLADLSPVAIATNASGAMGVRLTVPVYARYVLLPVPCAATIRIRHLPGERLQHQRVGRQELLIWETISHASSRHRPWRRRHAQV